MTEKKPLTETELKQLRRITVFRKIADVEHVKEVLKEGYAHWRNLAVDSSINARGAEQYLNGRADGWEEILQLISNSKSDGKEED